MDDVLENYNMSRFEECLHLLKKVIQEEDGLVENLINQNCFLVCQCLVFISENDSRRIDDTLRNLYKNYRNAVAAGLPRVVPLELELTFLFNFVWWSLFYVNVENNVDIDRSLYLSIIQRGLRRVLGISCIINKSTAITEDILYDIRNAGKKIQIRDYSTLCLTAEIIVLILLYILKVDCSTNVVVQCLETVTIFVKDIEKLIIGLEAEREFEDPCPLYELYFKFGFEKMNSNLSNINTTALDCLYIIKSLCFLLLKNYKNVLLALKKNLKPAMRPLWCYLGGLSSLMLGDFNQCLGFVVMSEGLRFDCALMSRFNILHGQLLSKKEDYNEALRYFTEARRITPTNAAAWYHMGEEYGKMGLIEDMVDCFKGAVKVKREYKSQNVSPFTSTFDSIILDILHPADEISESEATYAAAVACGLIERCQESADMFEKYIEIRSLEQEDKLIGDRIIKTPSTVTIFHEAATMNILAGNFSRAEFMLSRAVNHYSKLENYIEKPKKDVHVTKDVNWLRNLLYEELGLNSSVDEEKKDSIDLFSEEMVYFLEEDAIALMLSAEMESLVDEVACKKTLGKLISVFSKYLIQMQKKETIQEEEKLRWTLVKALSGRTFLNIAGYQMKGKTSAVEIERTFKRALSCNQGDKDILYGYSKFLLGEGRTSDAGKLWRTFHEKEPVLVVDQCQSLALRHLLRSKVTPTEWEEIEVKLHSSAMDVDFHH